MSKWDLSLSSIAGERCEICRRKGKLVYVKMDSGIKAPLCLSCAKNHRKGNPYMTDPERLSRQKKAPKSMPGQLTLWT